MSDQFLTTYDENGDLTVRGGRVWARGGSFRIGGAAVVAVPLLNQVGINEAAESEAEVYLGGSGRNLIVSGFPATAADGIWRHGYPGKWSFGGFVLLDDASGGAVINDGTDDVATLASGGPDGAYSSTAYGEALFSSAPFVVIVATENGWPGAIPPAMVDVGATQAKSGQYSATDAATFVSDLDADWTLEILESGEASLKVSGTAVATRTAGANTNPAGVFPSTVDGLPWNPAEHEEATDELPDVNPFGVLTITYSWTGSPDLDTTTEFLDGRVGYGSSGPSDFLTFTGDNTSSGSEVITVDLAAAFDAGHLGDVAVINCRADWYPPAGGSGPATLDVTYSVPGSTPISMTIHPGNTVTPAATLALALRVRADGSLETNYEAWNATVTRLRVPPPAGFVFLKMIESGGVLMRVDGPFFAAALPADTATEFHFPLVESDGAGVVERHHSGPILWPSKMMPPNALLNDDGWPLLNDDGTILLNDP